MNAYAMFSMPPSLNLIFNGNCFRISEPDEPDAADAADADDGPDVPDGHGEMGEIDSDTEANTVNVIC
jgi:hypothetical protein